MRTALTCFASAVVVAAQEATVTPTMLNDDDGSIIDWLKDHDTFSTVLVAFMNHLAWINGKKDPVSCNFVTDEALESLSAMFMAMEQGDGLIAAGHSMMLASVLADTISECSEGDHSALEDEEAWFRTNF